MKISEKTFSADQKRVDELSRKVLLLLADNDATDGEIIVALAKSLALGVFFAAQKTKVASPADFYVTFTKALADMYEEVGAELVTKSKLMEMAKKGGKQ